MLNLELENLRITVNTMEDKVFSAVIPFKKGLNIIRAENTSGKSTCVNAIMYALGLESVLGPLKSRPFPASLYDTIEEDKISKKPYTVISSNIELTLKNALGNKATLSRYVQGNNKIITVSQDNTIQDYFLDRFGTLGSAKSEFGFHLWLEKFMGWDLPKVPNFNGRETKLYLETIFPLFFIEQKRGWSEIQANVPSNWGIKSVKKTALEFVLGISTFSLDNKINAKRKEKEDLELEWDLKTNSLLNLCELSEVQSIDIKKIGIESFPLTYFLNNDSQRIPVLNMIKSLESKISNAEQIASTDNTKIDSLYSDIAELQNQKEKIHVNSDQLRIAIYDIKNKISILQRDIEKYKQLELLTKLGSKNNINIDLEMCPICNSKLSDTLHVHHNTNRSIPMTTEDNLNFLQEQHGFFKNIHNRYLSEFEKSILDIEKINNKITNQKLNINNLKSDMLKNNVNIRQEIRERIETENLLKKYKDFLVKALEIENTLHSLQNNYNIVVGSLTLLIAKKGSNSSLKVILRLEQIMRDNLSRFGYGGNLSKITISQQTFRPELDGYDIVAESSASDYIRVIWAYTLALLELAKDNKLPVKHGGFIVLDEPRQHEAKKESMEGLISYTSQTFSQGGQVILATSYQNLENIPMGVEPIYFHDYLLKIE